MSTPRKFNIYRRDKPPVPSVGFQFRYAASAERSFDLVYVYSGENWVLSVYEPVSGRRVCSVSMGQLIACLGNEVDACTLALDAVVRKQSLKVFVARVSEVIANNAPRCDVIPFARRSPASAAATEA